MGASAAGATAAGIAATTGAAGIGASIYGANKAAKSQQAAIDANKASVDEANRLNYQRWLESQGVGPDGKPVNVNFPRYFTSGPAGQPRRFKRIGSAPMAPAPAPDPNSAI